MLKDLCNEFMEGLEDLMREHKQKSQVISNSIQKGGEAFYIQRLVKFSAEENLSLELREQILRLLDKYFPEPREIGSLEVVRHY